MAGCYEPSLQDCSFRCAAAEPKCPTGQQCEAATGICRNDGMMGTACPGRPSDGGSDTAPTCEPACVNGKCVNGKCARRVFVTNMAYVNGGFGDADMLCQNAASGQSLGGVWLAWLSTSSKGSPDTRFPKDDRPYIRIDDKLVANDWASLTSGANLINPIAVSELGLLASGTTIVWTNTTSSGQPLSTVNTETCFDFTIPGSGYTASYGLFDHRDSLWTNANRQACCCDAGCVGCPGHLYCFEQ